MTTHIKKHMSLRPQITIIAILIDWLIIAFSIFFSTYFNNFFTIILAVIIIGSRQHALSVLSHDFVHFSVINNRTLSEYLGNIFTSWPLFYRISGFRSQHLEHHRHLNTKDDPDLTRRYGQKDWTFPKKKSSLYFLLLRDLLGINFYQNFKKLYILHNKKGKHKKNFKKERYDLIVFQIFFYISILFLVINTNNLDSFLIYWLLPFFTYHKFIKRLRAISEHFAIPNNNYEQQTRSIILGPLGSFLVCPRNVNFHLEHHLYPMVPWYNLRSLSIEARFDIEKQNKGHYTKTGLVSLINEVVNIKKDQCISNKILN